MSEIEPLDDDDDDYQEQLHNIELFEQEEEECQQRYSHEMLKQLEQDEELEQSRQILYYEWMQCSKSFKEKNFPWRQSIDLEKELQRCFTCSSKKYTIIHSNDNVSDDIENEQQEIKEEEEAETFVLARTLKEKSSLANISLKLNTSNLIKRIIKHTNVLYICSEEQWKEKVNNYMKQNSGFLFIGDMTPSKTTSGNDGNDVLMKMSDLVVKTLHHLLYRREITNEQYSAMMYYNQSIQFEVNKLDFIPKIHDNKIVLQPIIKSSPVEPMRGILHLINYHLQPLIENASHWKTFPTAYEAIQMLSRNYNGSCYYSGRPLLVTIHLHNLRTSLPHHLIIDGLENFFRFKSYEKIAGISTTTIIQLIRLILENQFFIYDNKLYQQIKGSSSDSPLMRTLFDIYLFYWQHDLLRKLNQKRIVYSRVFGRSLDQMFFVWNGSKEELYTFLQQKNLTHSNTDFHQMAVSVGYKLSYLDAEFSGIEGTLHTRVYHHVNFEPYVLPYISKKIRTKQSQAGLLRAALIRAVLYCSNEREFENELFYIELSFLLNDISLYFIQNIIANFFIEFKVDKKDICFDKLTYESLRSSVRRNYLQMPEYDFWELDSQYDY